MKIKIIQNPDKSVVEKVRKALADNDGYCPCRIDKTPENKCMCAEFIKFCAEGKTGECHCGLYIAKESV